MAIREDLVASAAQFLQDPSVASSPIENRIAFLQAKNLTQEEVNAALARAGSEPAPAPSYAAAPPMAAAPGVPPQAYYGQYPPYAWRPPPPEAPRRDWRDWFIMATVMGGVSYGLYALTKRYVYPLVAPPTPERLEQDKKSIDEQFEKAFALVDQLAKDTEALKKAEQERTERLDSALSELETVMGDLKSASRRREDEAQRVRDDVQSLKDAIPKALNSQKDLTDSRLREVNTELKSLKTLISQRVNPGPPSAAGGYLRPSGGNATPASTPASTPAAAAAAAAAAASSGATGNENDEAERKTAPADSVPRDFQSYAPGTSRSPPPVNGTSTKASIPAWQMAMANKNTATSNGSDAGSSAQQGASSSS